MTERIDEKDLPRVSPAPTAHLRAVQGGKSVLVPLPDVANASALVADAIDGVESLGRLQMAQAVANVAEEALEVVEQAGRDASALLADTQTQVGVVLGGLGYLPPVAFEEGLDVESGRFTVEYDGEVYAPVVDALPFTTTGTFDPNQWRLVQGVSGADLAASSGAAMVGLPAGGNLQQAIGWVTPEQFGAAGDDADVDTAAFLAAIAAAPVGGTVCATLRGKEYLLKEVAITKSLIIDLQGAKIKAAGNRVFSVKANIDFLVIQNCGGFDVGVTSGAHTVEFFSNWSLGDQQTYENIASGTQYNVKRLVLRDNEIGRGKVVITGDGTRELVDHCTWRYDTAGAFPLPAHLQIMKGLAPPSRTQGGVVRNCEWDVFAPSPDDDPNAGNYDIVKITRAWSSGVFDGNLLRNNNPDHVCAQIDLFTGADNIHFVNNTLRNVQLHRKQQVGANADPRFGMDNYCGNTFIVEPGFSVKYVTGPNHNNPVYMHGSMFRFVNNSIRNESDEPMAAIFFPQFDADYDEFGVESTTHALIAFNTVDLRADETAKTSAFLYFAGPPTGEGDSYLQVIGNTVVGGDKFYRCVNAAQRPQRVIDALNVWTGTTYSGGARQAELSSVAPQVSIGNIREGNTWFFGRAHGEPRRELYVSGVSTFNVAAADSLYWDGTTSISSLTDGELGQEVVLHKHNSQAVLVHSNSGEDTLYLKGGANFRMYPGSSIVLRKQRNGQWYEVARTDARRQSGTNGNRPTYEASEAGATYYNTTSSTLQMWDGATWIDVAGA